MSSQTIARPVTAQEAAAREVQLREQLAQQPADTAVLGELGVLCADAGRFDEGYQLLERAVALKPDDPRLRLAAAGIAASNGDLELAERQYRKALVLRAGLAQAHVGLGQIAESRGLLSSAEEQFRAALDADADHVPALMGLARIRLAEGHAEQAVQLFAHVTQQYPQHARALAGYGQSLILRGTPDQAVRPLKRALELDPSLYHVQLLLGQVELTRGNVHKAESAYREVLDSDPDNADALAGLGDALRAQDRAEEAFVAYDGAYRLRPQDELLATLRATCLADMGRIPTAIDDLRAFLVGKPNSQPPRLLLADLLQATGSPAEARAMWETAVERDAHDVLAHAELAQLQERAGDFAAANQTAVGSSKDNRPQICLMRARLAVRRQDYAAAQRELLSLKGARLPVSLARERFRLLGLVHDHGQRHAEAVLAFREAQRVQASPLPHLARGQDVRAGLQKLRDLPALEEPRIVAPVLLLGLPGSGVERIAALLADQRGVQVRDDRFDGQTDFFGDGENPSLRLELSQSQLAVQARRYGRTLQRHVTDAAALVVDWLPVFDARVMAVARRALPGLRAIVVDVDPEQAFLNWLAFGWERRLRINDMREAAHWWRVANEQIEIAAELLPCAHVNADALLADPATVGGELAQFLGVDAIRPGPRTQQRTDMLNGLPSHFAPGHAESYRSVLAEAFAALRDSERTTH